MIPRPSFQATQPIPCFLHIFQSIIKMLYQVLYEVFHRHILQAHMVTQSNSICLRLRFNNTPRSIVSTLPANEHLNPKKILPKTLDTMPGQPNYHVRFQHWSIKPTLASLFTVGWIDVWRGWGPSQKGGGEKKVSKDCPHIHTSLDTCSPSRSLYLLLDFVSCMESHDVRYMDVLHTLLIRFHWRTKCNMK